MDQKRDYITPGIISLILVAAAIIWRNRLGGDFWPIDRSYVGPNLLASGICVSVAFFWGVQIGRLREKRLHARLDTQDASLAHAHDVLKAHTDALEKHDLSHRWVAQAIQDIADDKGVHLLSHPHDYTHPHPKPAPRRSSRAKPAQN
jgi:hypothetical protein